MASNSAGTLEHEAPAYFVSRDGVTKEYVRGGRPRATARRLRRHPTADELRSLDTDAAAATLLGDDGPVIIMREYNETEPALLMGHERFVSVDESCSVELLEPLDDCPGAAPVAQACGPPLLPAAQGGPPEFLTLCEALEHTARHAPADRGITYVSRGRAVFESYATLRAKAGRVIGLQLDTWVYRLDAQGRTHAVRTTAGWNHARRAARAGAGATRRGGAAAARAAATPTRCVGVRAWRVPLRDCRRCMSRPPRPNACRAATKGEVPLLTSRHLPRASCGSRTQASPT